MADGQLIPFPDRDPEPDILEGEIVDEAPPLTPARRVGHAAAAVVRHPHTVAAGRNLAYVAVGGWAIGKRMWDSRTTARYEKFMRAAEAAGDHESVLQWEDRLARFRKDRHQRRTDLVKLPIEVIRMLPRIALGFTGVLAVIGILLAIASKDPGEIKVPFLVVAKVTEIIAIVFSVAWGPFILGAPWAALIVLWWFGRGYARMATTGWMVASKADEDAGLVVTADTIVLALQNLDKIPALKRAFKEGWRPTMYLSPTRDGRGYASVFSLPLGVTAGMIADQRAVFARNVHRAEVEVWPSDGEAAGTGPAGSVSVWIADPGVLSKPAPEYPLLHEGTADVFEGVPGGVAPRGDQIAVPGVGNNLAVGGQMGQGKSNALRVYALGWALDPLARIDVFVFANNGDFDAYRPRLAIYEKGVEDDTIAAAVSRLHELYAEVARREQRLADLGAKKLTRQLAQAHRDLRPILALFSECHELFGHPEHGALAADLATKTIKRARKTGIVLAFDTQSSRKEAIPPKLVELVSVNACFYVKTWRSNDGFLGDGSFAAGIRATELRPGRDRGTSIITGVSDGQFELLKWYFVEVDDDTGYDAAADVIARAVDRVAFGTPIKAAAVEPAAEARDLLEDLDEVLGDDRARLRDLVGLLRDLAPSWAPYRKLTAGQLHKALDRERVATVNHSGTLYLHPEELRRALAERGV
jgi:S-DNA-T family DNA segregation ATPase FtsK/SpoIIIE